MDDLELIEILKEIKKHRRVILAGFYFKNITYTTFVFDTNKTVGITSYNVIHGQEKNKRII